MNHFWNKKSFFIITASFLLLSLIGMHPKFANAKCTIGKEGDCGGTGCEYNTIREAMNNCSEGEELFIYPGVYNEGDENGITFKEKIMIITNGKPEDIIYCPQGNGQECGYGGKGFIFPHYEGSDTEVTWTTGIKPSEAKKGYGMTLKNFDTAIKADESDPILSYLTFTNNSQYAVYCENSAPLINNSNFIDNDGIAIRLKGHDPGLRIFGLGIYSLRPEIYDNLIRNSGGGIFITKTDNPKKGSNGAIIERNIIEWNRGNGVDIRDQIFTFEDNHLGKSQSDISYNTIKHNTERGIYYYDNDEGIIAESNITYNDINNNGKDGIYFWEPAWSIRYELLLENNTIVYNKNNGVYSKAFDIFAREEIVAFNENWGWEGDDYDGIPIFREPLNPCIGEDCPEIWYTDTYGNISGRDVNHSIFPYWDFKDGNIEEDPLFVFSDEAFYFLNMDSPCIGSGYDGDDMGAYPFKMNYEDRMAIQIPPDQKVYHPGDRFQVGIYAVNMTAEDEDWIFGHIIDNNEYIFDGEIHVDSGDDRMKIFKYRIPRDIELGKHLIQTDLDERWCGNKCIIGEFFITVEE